MSSEIIYDSFEPENMFFFCEFWQGPDFEGEGQDSPEAKDVQAPLLRRSPVLSVGRNRH